MLEFRKLRAEEIDVRVGAVSPKGYSLLLYKDARVDMSILDETIGAMNWQREHKEVKGNLFCGVSIWDEEKAQWITKWDCGAETITEKEKGESSDSFKRSCFLWGIGRELYTSPFIWINCECPDKKLPYEEQKRVGGMRVSTIEYKDNAISHLVIVDNKGNKIFTFGCKDLGIELPKIKAGESIVGEEIEDDEQSTNILINKLPNDIYNKMIDVDVNILKWAKFNKKRVCDLTLEDVEKAIIDKKLLLAKAKADGNN